MPIHFSCRTCGRKLRAPEEMEAKKVRCPKCQAVNRVPAQDHAPEPVEEEQDQEGYGVDSGEETADSEDRRPCPECGEMIKASAISCLSSAKNAAACMTRLLAPR